MKYVYLEQKKTAAVNKKKTPHSFNSTLKKKTSRVVFVVSVLVEEKKTFRCCYLVKYEVEKNVVVN